MWLFTHVNRNFFYYLYFIILFSVFVYVLCGHSINMHLMCTWMCHRSSLGWPIIIWLFGVILSSKIPPALRPNVVSSQGFSAVCEPRWRTLTSLAVLSCSWGVLQHTLLLITSKRHLEWNQKPKTAKDRWGVFSKTIYIYTHTLLFHLPSRASSPVWWDSYGRLLV